MAVLVAGVVVTALVVAVRPAAAGPVLVLPSSSGGSGVTAGTPAAGAGPMIVLDPGHSGRSIAHTTRQGLRDIDYPNYPEIYETFDISACVGNALRIDGYRVTLTKAHPLSSVSLERRGRIATDAHAALAVSVHDDHSQSPSFEATYSQRGVRHHGRFHAMYRGRGPDRTVFRRPDAAKRSDHAARVIARARSKAQHQRVRVTENVYTGRPPLEPGNLALVQLLTTRPWVYNEMGARTHGSTTQALSITLETRYATGLLRGIEAAVPLRAGHANPPSRGVSHLRGCLIHRVRPSPGHLTRPHRYLPYGWKD